MQPPCKQCGKTTKWRVRGLCAGCYQREMKMNGKPDRHNIKSITPLGYAKGENVGKMSYLEYLKADKTDYGRAEYERRSRTKSV